MKDKILEIAGKSYYVLQEVVHNNRCYGLTLPCDIKKDEVDEDSLVLMEFKNENEQLVACDVPEDKLAHEIFQKILNNLQETTE